MSQSSSGLLEPACRQLAPVQPCPNTLPTTTARPWRLVRRGCGIASSSEGLRLIDAGIHLATLTCQGNAIRWTGQTDAHLFGGSIATRLCTHDAQPSHIPTTTPLSVWKLFLFRLQSHKEDGCVLSAECTVVTVECQRGPVTHVAAPGVDVVRCDVHDECIVADHCALRLIALVVQVTSAVTTNLWGVGLQGQYHLNRGVAPVFLPKRALRCSPKRANVCGHSTSYVGVAKRRPIRRFGFTPRGGALLSSSRRSDQSTNSWVTGDTSS